jgi:hypothetical protein
MTLGENSSLSTNSYNGFLAYKGDEFLAYTARVDGIKRYYTHPKETICFKVLSPVFSIFSGIGGKTAPCSRLSTSIF